MINTCETPSIYGPPDAPPTLWEWELYHGHVLDRIAHARRHQLLHRYFPNQRALARANARLWTTCYRPSPLYHLWETWQAWLEEYRTLMVHMQELAEASTAMQVQREQETRTDESDRTLALPF
jgi:hypothetical protein